MRDEALEEEVEFGIRNFSVVGWLAVMWGVAVATIGRAVVSVLGELAFAVAA